MKIGILQADYVRKSLVEEHGEYPAMFGRLLHRVDPSIEIVAYDVQRGDYPVDIDEVDAYLITGSVSSVYDDKPWIQPLLEFTVVLHQACKPVVGICFGHQLIAQALGGHVAKSPKGWGMGIQTCNFPRSVDGIAEAGEQFRLYVSHQDQVDVLPEGAEVLAGNDFCPNAMIRLGQHIISWQGHPEFNQRMEQSLLDIRRAVMDSEAFTAAQQTMQLSTDELKVTQWMLGFLQGK